MTDTGTRDRQGTERQSSRYKDSDRYRNKRHREMWESGVRVRETDRQTERQREREREREICRYQDRQ